MLLLRNIASWACYRQVAVSGLFGGRALVRLRLLRCIDGYVLTSGWL